MVGICCDGLERKNGICLCQLYVRESWGVTTSQRSSRIKNDMIDAKSEDDGGLFLVPSPSLPKARVLQVASLAAVDSDL